MVERTTDGPDARHLAEVLWLTDQIDRRSRPTQSPATPPTTETSAGGAPPPPVAAHPSAALPVPSPSPHPVPELPAAPIVAGREEILTVVPPAGGSGKAPRYSSASLPVSLHYNKRSDLREPAALARALRPLKHRRADTMRHGLDEDASANLSAETGMLIPVLGAADEPWFDLAFVMDTSASMTVWHETGQELYALLTRQGAFREITGWRLNGDTGPAISPYPVSDPLTARPGTQHGPQYLHSPTGRTLIVLLTDAVGAAWYTPPLVEALTGWSEFGTLVVINPLPYSMWHRTALSPRTVVWRTPSASSPRLSPSAPGRPAHSRPDSWVPVLEASPAALAPWAAALAGTRHAAFRSPAVSTSELRHLSASLSESATADAEPVPMSPRQTLQRFKASASPTAIELAGLLAAAPMTLGVIRALQSVLLPQSRPEHLAEILLSGLIGRVDDQHRHGYDQILYDFTQPGLRDALLATVPRSDAFAVLEALGRLPPRLTERFGGTLDFKALVPEWGGPALLPPEVLPFANTAITVLSGMGPVHTAIAERIEAATDPRLSVTLDARPADRAPITALRAFRALGQVLAVVARAGGTLELWRLNGNDLVRQWFTRSPVDIASLSVANTVGGLMAVTSHKDGTVRTWGGFGLLTPPQPWTVPLGTPVTALDCLPDSGLAVLAGPDRCLHWWNLETMAYERFGGHLDREAVAVAITRDGNRVIGADTRGSLVRSATPENVSGLSSRRGRRRFLSLIFDGVSGSGPSSHTEIERRARQLADQFTVLGYTSSIVREPTPLEAAALLDALAGTSNGDDILVVHVAGHTQSDVPSEPQPSPVSPIHARNTSLDVDAWLSSLRNQLERPQSLLLLLDNAPGAVQASHRRASPTLIALMATYDDRQVGPGRFTAALSTVLAKAIARSQSSSTRDYLPLPAFVDEVRAELRTGSTSRMPPVEFEALSNRASLPFFPLPARYVVAEAPTRRDDHWSSDDPRERLVRTKQWAGLGQLTRWLHEDRQQDPLFVVCGPSASGKSTLMATAARELRAAAPNAQRGDLTSSRLASRVTSDIVSLDLAACDLSDAVGALASRFGMAPLIAGQPARSAAHTLLTTLAKRPSRPTLLLDNLDQATAPEEILEALVHPLAGLDPDSVPDHRWSDGKSPARLLVACRPVPALEELVHRARSAHMLVDLNTMPRSERWARLAFLVEVSIASHLGEPSTRTAAEGRRAFAQSVGRSLASTHPGWVGFAAARLHTRAVIAEHGDLPADILEAEGLGNQTPRELPHVVDLYLSGRNPLLFSVLSALAHAKGMGMPASVLLRLLPLWLRQEERVPDIVAVRAALLEADDLVTVQRRPDRDEQLYRLAHRSLADYFRDLGPVRTSSELEGLIFYALAPRIAGNTFHWQSQEPYVLRHILEHAIAAERTEVLLEDPEFLVQARMPADLLLLPLSTGPQARRMAEIYDAAVGHRAGSDEITWRELLAGTAQRLGHTREAESFVSHSLRAQAGTSAPAHLVMATTPVGTPIVITSPADGPLYEWHAVTGEQLWTLVDAGAVTALSTATTTDGTPVVISGTAEGTLHGWDAVTGRRMWNSPDTGTVTALSTATTTDGTPVVISGTAEGTLHGWHAATGRRLRQPTTLRVTAVDGTGDVFSGPEGLYQQWRQPLMGSLHRTDIELELDVPFYADLFRTSSSAGTGSTVGRALRTLFDQLSWSAPSVSHPGIINLAAYLSSPTAPLRSAVQDRIAGSIERNRSSVVVAHSMGGVLAYEALWAHPSLHVKLLVTLGTPLAMKPVLDRLLPEHFEGRLLRPPGVGRWIDITQQDDPSSAFRLSKFFDGVTELRTSEPFPTRNSLEKYLTSPELRHVLLPSTD